MIIKFTHSFIQSVSRSFSQSLNWITVHDASVFYFSGVLNLHIFYHPWNTAFNTTGVPEGNPGWGLLPLVINQPLQVHVARIGNLVMFCTPQKLVSLPSVMGKFRIYNTYRLYIVYNIIQMLLVQKTLVQIKSLLTVDVLLSSP